MNAACENSSRDKGVQELRQQVTDLTMEVTTWRKRLAEKEEEYKTNERDMRKSVMEGDKKAHETWVGKL